MDRVDAALMEKYWRSLIERADYPGKMQKVDVALMINWQKVRMAKMRHLILDGKWPKASVLAIISCHLLLPLCADLHNQTEANKTEVRKMLKRLEKAMVKETENNHVLYNYLLTKIEFMKRF